MKLPIDIRDIVSSGSKLREDREKPVRIAVFVDVEAPDALVEAFRAVMHPQTGSAMLHIEACSPGETLMVDPGADAVIALAGPGTTLERSLAAAREQFVPTAVVSCGESALDVAHRLGQPVLDSIAGEDCEHAVRVLGAWLADRVSGKRLALAHNFVFLRRAVAEEAIKATAFQNGVIGFVMVIPGADMPLMTANQAKMILQMAAAYGQPLGPERIKELAMVVGGGLTMRAVARQVLTLVPGFGWAVKAGIGYTGTLAMGYAAMEYFEEGGDFGGLAQRVREARDKVIEAARDRVKRGLPAEDPIPAHGYVVTHEHNAATPSLPEHPQPEAQIPSESPAEGAGVL